MEREREITLVDEGAAPLSLHTLTNLSLACRNQDRKVGTHFVVLSALVRNLQTSGWCLWTLAYI